MNAAETIQAAIDKLENLRRESNEGDIMWSWERVVIEGSGKFRQSDIVDGAGAVIVERCWTPDAELIVTLHRTIDAQLKILRHDLEIRARYERKGIPLEAWESAVNRAGDLDLAHAILGGDS